MTQVSILAEIAGRVWKLERKPGDEVGPDDSIIESMKMEIPVFATVAGRVQALHVVEGEEVAEGKLLSTIETS